MIAFGSEIVKKLGVEVAPKTNVVKEGEKTREMYIVHKGQLEVVKIINEQEQVISFIKEGEFFGELSLLNGEPRSATVRAVEKSVVLKISPASFESLIKKLPDLAISIIKSLAARLQKTNEQVTSLQEQDDDIKLYKTILSKLNTIGHKTVKGIRVPASIDHIASEIKSPEETVLSVKKDLECATNVINFLDEGAFEIPNVEYLQEFIQFIELRKKVVNE